MIELITHGINLLRCKFRDVGISTKRSGQWPTVEKHFREEHPVCAACGGKKNLNVHHCIPFSTAPNLELIEDNLLTLCMGKLECHLRIGHGNDFHHYNKNVKQDVIYLQEHPNEFEHIAALAKANRIPNK